MRELTRLQKLYWNAAIAAGCRDRWRPGQLIALHAGRADDVRGENVRKGYKHLRRLRGRVVEGEVLCSSQEHGYRILSEKDARRAGFIGQTSQALGEK